MKVLGKTEEMALKIYVAFRSHMATSRGQGSLEYIAIAIGIVIVAAVAFAAFRTPIQACGTNILHNIFGSPASTLGTQCL